MQERYRQMYLTQARLASFQRRVEQTKERVLQFLETASRPFAGFSGGKDSTCLLILLSELGRTDVPVFTQGDDLDWPDKRPFCEHVTSLLGLSDYSYRLSRVSALDQFRTMTLDGQSSIRGTFSHVVARYVRERHRNGVMMGLRQEESAKRRILRATRGHLYQTTAGEWRSIPLADWSGLDVFALILSRGAPYMHVYDCDALQPPDQIRMSWMLNPAFLQLGSGAWLKRYYPEQYARLCRLNPPLSVFG